jgi:branched-chain amino acid transport system substrate-binding protein
MSAKVRRARPLDHRGPARQLARTRPPSSVFLSPRRLPARRSILPLVAAVGLAACGREAGPVVLGLTGPFSEARGRSMRRAAELAVAEINARGGVRGRRLDLRVLDDSASEDVALRVAQTLRDDPAVVAVIGHLTSGPTLAAAPVYGGGARPVALISPSASSPALSGISPYFFRVCPSDLAFGSRLARYAVRTLGARRVAVIYMNDDYGRGVRETFRAELARLGGRVVSEDPYLPSAGSFEPYLARLVRGGEGGAVDALLLAMPRVAAERALRETAALALRWPVLGGDALTGIETLGPPAEGVRVASAYLPDRPDQRNAAFVAQYERVHDGARPDHRGAGAYDIVQLLARAIEEVGADRLAVRDYLASVGRERPAFDGVTGRIAFDSAGDVPDKPVLIGVVRNGRLVTETSQ